MSLLETVGEHVREHRGGLLVDLVFATVWVTMVSVVFALLPSPPQWAYYLAMGSGVLAYYGFFWSLDAAQVEE